VNHNDCTPREKVSCPTGAQNPLYNQPRNIRLEEGLDTVLEEGDYLAIFPPVAGGKG